MDTAGAPTETDAQGPIRLAEPVVHAHSVSVSQMERATAETTRGDHHHVVDRATAGVLGERAAHQPAGETAITAPVALDW